MKQILVIFTGGTIGSTASQGTIDTDSQAGFKLLDLFQAATQAVDVRFTTLQPVQILSENLHPGVWQQLITTLSAQDLSVFDGVIVTHGTDTLAFTAAALALYFNSLPIPLVLVSSDYPLDHPQANGLANFCCAVELIKQRPMPGAFVAYQNAGQIMQVHLASRLAASLQLSGDFISVQNRPYLSFVDGQFIEHFSVPPRQPQILPTSPDFAKRVLLIKPYPGLDYRQFLLDGVDVVLHDLYHSGTACATAQWGEAHDLVAFMRRCQQRHLPVYLAPILRSDDAYQSTRELMAHGAQFIWNTSLEAAYAKLLLAYSCFGEPQAINDFLARNVAWEQV